MAFWVLARKELRVLLRDRLAVGLLLGMPLLFILVLGQVLGEGFGQKPDDRLRVSLVDLDEGPCDLGGADPKPTWSQVVLKDLAETADIRVEVIPSLEEAKQLVEEHKRAAVLVFQPGFSRRVNQCSFLKGEPLSEFAVTTVGLLNSPLGTGPLLAASTLFPGRGEESINPFHRDGVYLNRIDALLLRDDLQPGTASLIDQVGQVTLLRVLLPWMIGRAFERLSDPKFIQILGDEVNLPVPSQFQTPLFVMSRGKLRDRITLGQMLDLAADNNPDSGAEFRKKVGAGVQAALARQFANYNLTGKTWASLTKSKEDARTGAEVSAYENRDGSGFLKRGAQRYQVLVPSLTVMFSFFLALVVSLVFVTERRQGTLRRLQAAPLTRPQILLGKLAPYLALSVFQGVFLMAAGWLLFGMRWGPADWSLLRQAAWLLPVVLSTSLAATGLALLVAAVTRSEMQVVLYGAVPVLVLALVGGCVLPPEMMPESGRWVRLLTPQGWALEAYREFLTANPHHEPNVAVAATACGVLFLFGAGFLGLAWSVLRLD
jgi:ABC-type multidrug transport system permease subunit